MQLSVPSDDIISAFSPAIRRRVVGDDAAWNAEIERLERKLNKRTPFWRRWLTGRTEARVKQIYEGQWGPKMALDRLDLRAGKPGPVVYKDDRYFASSMGIKRVHLLYLMHVIDALKPKRVLEIGFGTGQTLLILAARHPTISFTGIELTEAGTMTAKALRDMPILAQELRQFSPLPLQDLSAHRNVLFLQASAKNLPFDKKSFDLVYSTLALEQMESIRGDVMREIERVTNGHVAMVEPFADWNKTGIRNAKVRSLQYFACPIADLPDYGLQPVFVSDDMPNKLGYGVGLVVAATQ
jgi:SAM-dependent methyltransferase